MFKLKQTYNKGDYVFSRSSSNSKNIPCILHNQHLLQRKNRIKTRTRLIGLSLRLHKVSVVKRVIKVKRVTKEMKAKKVTKVKKVRKEIKAKKVKKVTKVIKAKKVSKAK